MRLEGVLTRWLFLALVSGLIYGCTEEQRRLLKQRICFRVRFADPFSDAEQDPADQEYFATPFGKLWDNNQSGDESGCLVRQRVGEGHAKRRGKIRPKRKVLSLLTVHTQVDEPK